MSLYREAGRRRRRRIVAGAGAVAVLLVIALVVVLTSGGGDRSPADRRAESRAAAQTARDGLELLGIEYGQAVRGGRVVAATEYEAAQADVERARDALAEHRADFAPSQARVVAQVDAILIRVRRLVDQHADTATVERERRRATRLLVELAR